MYILFHCEKNMDSWNLHIIAFTYLSFSNCPIVLEWGCNFRVNMHFFWVLTYEFFYCRSCSCDGWIWAKDRGSFPWHTSCLQRIFSEAGMLCFRKVSVTHNHHVVSLRRTVKKIWQWFLQPVWPCVACFCSPVPSISWRKADGNPLPGKIKINHSTGDLEIPYFRPEDAGVYECVAENSRGRNVASGKLVFQSKSNFTISFVIFPGKQRWLFIFYCCFFSFSF